MSENKSTANVDDEETVVIKEPVKKTVRKKRVKKPEPTPVSDTGKEIDKKNYNKELARERFNHKKYVAMIYLRKMMTLKYWIDLIQSFEDLFMVLFINIQMLLIVTSAVFAIYFIYYRDWKMTLTSIAVYFTISWIMDKVNSSDKNKSEGE